MADNKKNSVLYYLFAWIALFGGVTVFMLALFNRDFLFYQKAFYLTVLALGTFSMWSTLECIRNKGEGIPVTGTFQTVCWLMLIKSSILLGIGLWYTTLSVLEIGFFSLSYFCSLFGVICIQKLNRDGANFGAAIIEIDIPASALVGGVKTTNEEEKFHGFKT